MPSFQVIAVDDPPRFGDLLRRELGEVLLPQHFAGAEDDHIFRQRIEILLVVGILESSLSSTATTARLFFDVLLLSAGLFLLACACRSSLGRRS